MPHLSIEKTSAIFIGKYLASQRAKSSSLIELALGRINTSDLFRGYKGEASARSRIGVRGRLGKLSSRALQGAFEESLDLVHRHRKPHVRAYHDSIDTNQAS